MANGESTDLQQALQSLQGLLQQGAFAQALDAGEGFAARFPDNARIANMVALAQMQLGRAEAALAGFSRAADLDRAYAGPHVNTANLLVALGRFAEAEPACRAALSLVPDGPERAKALYLLGMSLARTGRPAEAAEAFRGAVELAPDMAQAHNGLGSMLAALQRQEEALEVFLVAAGRWPDEAELQRNLGRALAETQRYDEAVAHLRAAIGRHPDDIALFIALNRALRDMGRFEEALGVARETVPKAPDRVEVWGQLGASYRELGMRSEAIAALDRALSVSPDDPAALAGRWQLEPLPLDHPDHARISAQSERQETPYELRAALELILFEAHDNAGEAEAAFRHLEAGNAIRRAAEPYEISDQARVLEAVKAAFHKLPAQLPEDVLRRIPAPGRPVFIVGMPRSGTSLVEQILASHPGVFGGGELPALGTSMAKAGWRIARAGEAPTGDMLATLRQRYFEQVVRSGADRPVFTDKTPLNFRWLGFALSAMPEARVLYVRRDARATCWSNYRHNLRGRANGFGNDMADTAEMFRLHLDIMAFWQERFPDRIATVPYERLTEVQEEESRKLVEAAGLGWDDACLAFHEARRGVRTASALQVRKQIYTGSSEVWRRYEAFLGPMLERLDGLA